MTKNFCALGECMVEMSVDPATGMYGLSFAGDTFNTAWYLRQASPATLDVSYLTGVGNDAISQRLIDFMKDAGITPAVQVVPDRTLGLYLIELENGERSFQYWRSTSAAKCLADDLGALAALEPGDMAYFSGITIAILSAKDRAVLLEALRTARARGVRIAFDPNLRPRLWQSLDEMRDWIMQAAAVSDIALPSYEDEATTFKDADKAATLARYLNAGADTVVVKDGTDDVLVQGQGENPQLVSPQKGIIPVDTTAAGDSFNAAFLAALIGGAPMGNAVLAGCALSAHVVQHRGALVPVPT